MADFPLCVNCVAYIRRDATLLDACGKVPMDLNVQYVRDEPPVYSYCTTQRSRNGGSCGPEGRLFEAAPLELKLTQEWRGTSELTALLLEAGVDPLSAPAEGASDAPA